MRNLPAARTRPMSDPFTNALPDVRHVFLCAKSGIA